MTAQNKKRKCKNTLLDRGGLIAMKLIKKQTRRWTGDDE